MPAPTRPIRRRRRLVKPKVQLKLCLVFLCVGMSCILVQFVLWSVTIADLSTIHPEAAETLVPALWRQLGICVALLVPLTLSVGILVTHTVVGPVYNFERYLEKLDRDGYSRPCKIRDGDEFGELCHFINVIAERFKDGSVGAATPQSAEEESVPS